MGALSADRNTLRADGRKISVPVAATTDIFAGSIVADNGSGYAIPMTDGSTYVCLGIAAARADNDPGSAGDIRVECEFDRAFWLVNSGLTIANRGAVVYADNDQTVRAFSGTNDNPVGILMDVDATKGALVYVPTSRVYITGTVPVDLSVGQDATITRNLGVGGTGLHVGVATFSAKSVHSLGITITAGGQTITAGNLLVTAGNITSTLGNILATKGNITATEGDVVITKGALTMTAGSATLTKGDLTLTEGAVTLTKGALTVTEGAVTMTKGALTLTAGDLTMTKGTFKMAGVSATEGVQVGYVSAATGATCTSAECDSAFGAKAAGRNGFIGILDASDDAAASLVFISNGVWYALPAAAV